MKKGQKATFICPPDYAYGEEGCYPFIKANETIKFEVELLKFTIPIRCRAIVIKHVECRNPIIRNTGIRTKLSREEAYA